METMEDVVIVGAGIAGLATALALQGVGVKALVLEKSDSLRTTGAALTLLPNAWRALDVLGVSHKLTSLYSITLSGSVTNIATGDVQELSFVNRGSATNSATGADQEVSFANGPRSVHRKVLLEALANELPADSIRYSSEITSIDVQKQEGATIPVVHLQDGTVIKSKVLIGCDGVHSVVAKWLQLSAPIHSGRSAVRGLAVYPQGHGFKQEVNQFVDVGERAGFVPLNDKELYWFATGFEGKDMPRNPETIQKQIMEKYGKRYPSEYLDVVRHADLSSVTMAPLMFRNPVNIIFGNLSKGNVTVAGDAMHPMTPDLAQGGCSALEDAVVLGRHIGNSFIRNGKIAPEEMPRELNGYVKERKWRAAWLITGAYLSGWVQQSGSNWFLKFLRDAIFYGLIFNKLSNAILYDCGTLPTASDELHSSKKTD